MHSKTLNVTGATESSILTEEVPNDEIQKARVKL